MEYHILRWTGSPLEDLLKVPNMFIESLQDVLTYRSRHNHDICLSTFIAPLNSEIPSVSQLLLEQLQPPVTKLLGLWECSELSMGSLGFPNLRQSLAGLGACRISEPIACILILGHSLGHLLEKSKLPYQA